MLKMKNLLIAVSIGVIAGIIDVIPMILQKLEKRANLAAFLHYLLLGIIIPFVQWEVPPWLKGLIIAELFALPVMVLVSKDEKKAIIPMILMAAILGMAIGVAGDRFIHI